MKQILKYILCIFLTVCSVTMSAQAQQHTAFSEDVVFRNGKLYVGDVRLTGANAADYLSASQAKRYVNAYRTETVGGDSGMRWRRIGNGIRGLLGCICGPIPCFQSGDYRDGYHAGGAHAGAVRCGYRLRGRN